MTNWKQIDAAGQRMSVQFAKRHRLAGQERTMCDLSFQAGVCFGAMARNAGVEQAERDFLEGLVVPTGGPVPTPAEMQAASVGWDATWMVSPPHPLGQTK